MSGAVDFNRVKFSVAFAYTVSLYGFVPGGRSISARETRRKLNGLPSASAAASSALTTSYGTAATRAAESGAGRRALNGTSEAIEEVNYSRLRVSGGHGTLRCWSEYLFHVVIVIACEEHAHRRAAVVRAR